MFLHLCVILFTGGWRGWLPSMHHRSHDQGVCIGVLILCAVTIMVNKRVIHILLECILVAIIKSQSHLYCVSSPLQISLFCAGCCRSVRDVVAVPVKFWPETVYSSLSLVWRKNSLLKRLKNMLLPTNVIHAITHQVSSSNPDLTSCERFLESNNRKRQRIFHSRF